MTARLEEVLIERELLWIKVTRTRWERLGQAMHAITLFYR